MKIEVFDDLRKLRRAAAARIVASVRGNPELVLCLPTGRTPRPVYSELVRGNATGRVSFARARVLHLDEYVGLGPGDAGSFAQELRGRFLDRIDVPDESVFLIDGRAPDPEAEAARYEGLIAWLGGIDLLVCGLGQNGHVAFNEPGSDPAAGCHVVELEKSTLRANAGQLRGVSPMPRQAVTLGLGNIVAARDILLLATGEAKARPLARLMEGRADPQWPVTALAGHPSLTVLADRQAAGG